MRSYLRTAVAGLAVLALSACDSDDDIPSQTLVRVIHAVADAPAVDVISNDRVIVPALGFRESTGNVALRTGTSTISVEAITPGGNVEVIPPTDVVLSQASTYSVVALGSAAGDITPLVLENDRGPIAAGNVRVQAVHGAASAPPVDIYVTPPGDPIVPGNAIAGGSTPFGAASDRLEIPGGDYRIRVTLPGETTPIFDSGTVTLPTGSDLLVVAVDNTVAGRDLPGASPITLLVSDTQAAAEIVDQDTPAEVRVVHAVPDANAVDIYVDDPMALNTPAIEDLDYTGIVVGPNEYLPFEPGTANVLVTGANNPGFIAIPATDVELSAGAQYTIYASGSVAAGIAPYITADDDRSVVTEAKTRIVHLAPGAGLVDIYVTEPMADITGIEPTLQDVDFGADTGYLGLAAGSYDVTVTLADTKDVAIGPATVTLEAGGVYTAVARDPDVDVIDDGFGLILLDDF